MSQNKTLLHEACDLSLCSIRGMPKKTNRCINVSGKEFVDFATGSYLGMEHIKEYQDFAVDTIRNYGLGSRSSPLYVASEYYTMIESKVSKITSLPKVIIFNSCTLANQAIIRYALPSNCHFLIDEFAHRSLIEPIKNKNTKMSRYRHVNINDMENKLVNMPSNVPKAIISDGVFSMSGQTAPIKDLLEIAKKYNCYLVIDDTHGFAINGQMGEGSLSGLGKYDDSNVIYIGSLSKALPGVGGFVACSEAIGNRICCRSSQYGFSCCLPFYMLRLVQRRART
ncbi:pyridoxal phosphate-dependent aminotransferase family protein [Candidatus Pacearchaeota archaeon]|nr:pyridoxal phosphate-dependent aminotransferase family protein [Candidatus Pacearchaeota archaeon]